MQIPKGDVSVFYYKSKLNVFNFTIYDLKENSCECYVWDELTGQRGVNELGTCVHRYLEKKTKNRDTEVIFYSDNCPGQQKNRFMIGLYLHAVKNLGIKSITHKYLIKGHTQNEGDSAHSLIERQVKRQLRGGPMYSPDAFISAIRAAKKTGTSFNVNELTYEDFLDVKDLGSEIVIAKLADIKVIKVQKEYPTSAFIKTSYEDEFFKKVDIIKRKKPRNLVALKPAYTKPPGIQENKKKDLLDLVYKSHIPRYYFNFYNNL